MAKNHLQSPTGRPSGDWSQRASDTYKARDLPTHTHSTAKADAVLLRGKYIGGKTSDVVVVSMNPAEIDKQIAIRQINGLLSGKTARSTTRPIGKK